MENSIFGKVYVQGRKFIVGESSYHFDSPNNCYIRFDAWNSNRFPDFKPFTHTKYDPKNRVFIGLIDWTDQGGPEGESYWLYYMVFSEDFVTIERGHVTCDGKSVNDFSERLNYVNLTEVIKAEADAQAL